MSLTMIWNHLALVLSALILAVAAGVPLGLVAYLSPNVGKVLLWAADLIQTIPALALLGVIMVIAGPGSPTAMIGLALYSLLPIARNTSLGLSQVPAHLKEAAAGMGGTETQTLLRVKLPMAAGVILAGVRNMVVMTVSVAGIASFVGAGGLGVSIYRGITIYNPAMTAAGSIFIAALAVLLDVLLGRLEKHLKKYGS